MYITFPSKAIKQEYNELKASQKPVKVSTTSRQMDEYVYDKHSGIKKLGLLSLMVLVNVLFASFTRERKSFSKIPWKNNLTTAVLLGTYDISAIAMLREAEKLKEATFASEKSKIHMYKKAGLNAIA